MTDDLKTVRWKQRFVNFSSSFDLLTAAIAIDQPSEVERAGLIQFFEMTFELSWKLLKDYLEAEGFMVKTPRQVLKQAFQTEYISDGESWLRALGDRNLTVHTYEEQIAVKVEQAIRNEYYPMILELYEFFTEAGS